MSSEGKATVLKSLLKQQKKGETSYPERCQPAAQAEQSTPPAGLQRSQDVDTQEKPQSVTGIESLLHLHRVDQFLSAIAHRFGIVRSTCRLIQIAQPRVEVGLLRT